MASTDTHQGAFSYGSHFIVTAIGDLPEIDIQSATGVATAIVNKHGGFLDVPVAASDDDDVAAVSLGAVVFEVDESDLWAEIRFEASSITDMKWFFGFGDSLASADETSFSATTDTVTIDTMTDAIGFLFDNDATTKVIWCVAGAADAVTVNTSLASSYNLVAGVPVTLRIYVAKDGKSAQWSINGKEVHRVYGTTQLVGATAALVPGFWAYEQGTASTYSVDFLFGGGYVAA